MKKIGKWFRGFVIRICEFNIIMSKATIASIEFLEIFGKHKKDFKEKLNQK